MNTILILGGYGGVGKHLARWLLRETDVRLIVAGRRKARAEAFVAELNHAFAGQRAEALVVDAARADSLNSAFAGVRLVVVCTPTTEHTPQVARAALAADIDYLDMHFPSKLLSLLEELRPQIEKQGRCFITQAGFHPGLLAPLVHLAAGRFDEMREVAIGMVMRFRFASSDRSTAELLELCEGQMKVLAAGRWRQAGLSDFRKFDFGPDLGVQECAPLDFAEMHALPERYGLREAGCYAAGFNWFVDRLLFPAAWLLGKIRPGLGSRLLGRCFVWAVNTFSRPPWGVTMRLEARGQKEGQPLSVALELRHPDVYEFTAVAVLACLKQYLDRSIARPGLWLMGNVVEPIRLFQDLEHLGVEQTEPRTPPVLEPLQVRQ